MVQKQHALYHVGLKVLLKKGQEYLFLSMGNYSEVPYLDLPGGRIDADEQSTSISEILGREIREELGSIQYQIIKPVVHFRRYFPDRNLRIFVVVYEAEYISGDISLSDEHSGYKWLLPSQLSKMQFCSEEEYQALHTYFSCTTNPPNGLLIKSNS